MRLKYKYIVLVITLITVLILLLMFMKYKRNNSNQVPYDIDNDVYKFYIFEYTVPEELKFSDYKNKQFKIEGNGWYAIVGIVYDKNAEIYGNTEKFQSIIKKYGYNYNIAIGDVITVDDTKVITFIDEHGNGLLCFFATDFGIDYEIEIFNADGSYKTDALNEIIEPLLNVTYENDGSNDFYAGYFSTDDEENDTTN